MKNDKDNKAPGFWFYPGDYERDVQVLSLSSQGLWMRMLCWAGGNESHRGFIELQSGEPMTEEDISSKVGRPIKAVRDCLAEMKRAGIFSIDSRGCIFNRRMARESSISVARKRAADSRWEKAKLAAETNDSCTDFAYAKSDAKNMQKPSVTVTVSDTVSTLPPAPKNGAGEVDEFESWLKVVATEIHDRHPIPRRDIGIKGISDRLRKICNKAECGKLGLLAEINDSHEAHCACPQWKKDGGEYAKGLDNWLAPTMRRWEGDVPEAPLLETGTLYQYVK